MRAQSARASHALGACEASEKKCSLLVKCHCIHFSWHYELKPQLLTTEHRFRSFLSLLSSAHLICKIVIFDYDGKESFVFVSQGGNIPIKLNAATIMREGALFQKKEEEELKK